MMKKILLLLFLLFIALQTSFTEENATQKFSVIAAKYDFYPETITVKKGIPVEISVTSIDVDHGISIMGLKISSGRIEKGKVTVFTFTPEETGEFKMECDVMCGSGHRNMRGILKVVD